MTGDEVFVDAVFELTRGVFVEAVLDLKRGENQILSRLRRSIEADEVL